MSLSPRVISMSTVFSLAQARPWNSLFAVIFSLTFDLSGLSLQLMTLFIFVFFPSFPLCLLSFPSLFLVTQCLSPSQSNLEA